VLYAGSQKIREAAQTKAASGRKTLRVVVVVTIIGPAAAGGAAALDGRNDTDTRGGDDDDDDDDEDGIECPEPSLLVLISSAPTRLPWR
jgi:hypothetical protein